MNSHTIPSRREEFIQSVISSITEIAFQREYRMKHFSENSLLLAKGIMYGNEHFKALKVIGDKTRRQEMVTQGIFYHGIAPSDFFDPIPDSHQAIGFVPYHFIIKTGVMPSQALESLRAGLTFIGCGEVCQLSWYYALKSVFGDEKFDALFDPDSTTPLVIGFSDIIEPNGFFNLIKYSTDTPRIGDIVYIKNIPEYRVKHINGESSGYQCILTPSGFKALGLPSEGVTQQEVGKQLLNEFNEAPICKDIVTADAWKKTLKMRLGFVNKTKSLKNARLSEQEFKDHHGGDITTVITIAEDRLEMLLNSSTSQARLLMDGWQKARMAKCCPTKGNK